MKYFILFCSLIFVIFADAKDALLLHLLPTQIKPTGKPQRSVQTAMKEFVDYTDDLANVQESNTHPPYILIVTEPSIMEEEKENIRQITVYCDGYRYVCSSILQALGILYKIYWVFGVSYPPSTHNVWMVIQKYFFKMTFKGEAISPAGTKFLKKLS